MPINVSLLFRPMEFVKGIIYQQLFIVLIGTKILDNRPPGKIYLLPRQFDCGKSLFSESVRPLRGSRALVDFRIRYLGSM